MSAARQPPSARCAGCTHRAGCRQSARSHNDTCPPSATVPPPNRPVPAHYNDPGIIERSVPLDANDQFWSTRAIFAHGIKTASHFRTLRQRWNMSRPHAELKLRCHPCNDLPHGVNKHYGHWLWARVPCPGTDDGRLPSADGVGRFCHVSPRQHFKCCNFPWDIPASIRAEAEARRIQAQAETRAGRGKGRGRGGGRGVGRAKAIKALKRAKRRGATAVEQ